MKEKAQLAEQSAKLDSDPHEGLGDIYEDTSH